MLDHRWAGDFCSKGANLAISSMLEDHLRHVEVQVALGERNIARQRESIARLRAEGHDPRGAEKLLRAFKELQSGLVASRDSLRNLNSGTTKVKAYVRDAVAKVIAVRGSA